MSERARTGERFPPASASLPLLLACLFGALFALGSPSCLERRQDPTKAETRCASCHGDPRRAGSLLERAAPPGDLSGASAIAYPGVGAHAVHLAGSETHAPVSCDECHRVPERTDSPGHADDARPAEVVFGPLAAAGGREPSYDARARTCSDTACHRAADAFWTEPRSSKDACGSCHGLPPPAPHPESERCSLCHAQVAGDRLTILAPELHVNGTVETSESDCTSCHGAGIDPAPPPDTAGNRSPETLGVGAHRAHLDGGAFGRPLECAECHAVPEDVDDPGHIDRAPAEVALGGVAAVRGRDPHWDRANATCADTWCHAPSQREASGPSWIAPGALACTSCHGLPPAAPHPQIGDCALCHGDVVSGDPPNVVERARHVDGIVDVSLGEGCGGCHGAETAAPPPDLDGLTSPASDGVGAHQAHLGGTPRARAVPCGECHRVPGSVFEAGHLDSARPAEVIFSGAASAFGGAPEYAQGRCSDTSCHGAAFPGGHRSGGTLTEPEWTRQGGTQAACGSCHGLPPPAPHPYGNLNPTCSACHENIASDNQTFTRPELHVDGEVTFVVP